MAEYPGDASEEDIKNQMILDLRKALVGATEDRTVTIPAPMATLLLELLPEVDEEEHKEKMQAQAPKTAAADEEDDDDDDDPGSTAASTRRAAPRHRK
jgi:hypothetical protein